MLHGTGTLYQSHPVFFGAMVMALANAAVTAMPSPRADSSQFYSWAFNFLHSAVGAISRIVAQYKATSVSSSAGMNGNANSPEAP